MPIQLINIGALPNDGTGDPLRTAFQKINNNFIYLERTSTDITSAVTTSDAPDQIIFAYPADMFTQAVIQVQSYAANNLDSQNAILSVQIFNDMSDVKWTASSITNVGDWLTQYGMDVFEGEVRLKVSPIQNKVITHFIAYQVTFAGDLNYGVPLTTENNEDIMIEADNAVITTES